MVIGKKGEELTTPIIMILLLDILIFAVLFTFVSQASSGALVYEKVYAKQIAFSLDSARPGTDITLDFSKAVEIAKKNGLKEEALAKLVTIDTQNNLVKVSLRGNAGQSMKYFSNYNVVYVLSGDVLTLRIREAING